MDNEADDASHVQKPNSVRQLYDPGFRNYSSRNLQFEYLNRDGSNASVDQDEHDVDVKTERQKEETGQLQHKDLLKNIDFSTESADLSLSLPIRKSKQITRDDWNEVATLTLLKAWSEKCKQLTKSNLKLEHWAEVADMVTMKSNNRKTDVQCKNRVDTLKKKYKHEKQKQTYGTSSKWPYFHLLEKMLCSNSWPGNLPSTVNACNIINKADLHRQSVSPSHTLASSICKRTHKMIHSSDNGDEGHCDKDRTSRKQMKKDASYKVLSTAVVKFGEIFDKIEKCKHQQIRDLEITRKKFTKDLEQQRIQLFMQAQKELAKLKRETVNFETSVRKMSG